MKILVTGGTGNVGAEVVKELRKRKAASALAGNGPQLLSRNDPCA